MADYTVSEALAEFTVNPASLPSRAIHGAKRCVVDAVGCALAGSAAPGIEGVAEQLFAWGGRPESTVWWRGQRLCAPSAAFANSVALHALDMDDVHIPSTTHLTSVIVPSAFAVGEAAASSGAELLAAVAMGIEVAARLGVPAQACRCSTGYLPTTVFGIFGATAAAARLLGLGADATANAFGLAYAQVSGNRQALFDHTLAKRLQPAMAARAGLASAYFAARGLTGARRVVEGQAGLFALYGSDSSGVPSPDDVADERDEWEVERLSYKSYACCGASHPLIQATIELAVEHDLTLSDVAEAEILGVSNPFAGVPWDAANPTQEQAQFCAPYQVAAAIKHRRFGPAEIAADHIVAARDISKAACRIKVASGDDYPVGQTVRIHTTDGKCLVATRGRDDVFTGSAMSDAALTAKFDQITGDPALGLALWALDRVDCLSDFTREYLHEPS